MANDQTTLPDEFKILPDDLRDELSAITSEDEGDNDQMTQETIEDQDSGDVEPTVKAESESKPELDQDLFKVENKQEPDSRKQEDRETVRQNTINNALKRVVDENGEIDTEKFNKLPTWVQKGVEESLSFPEEDPLAVVDTSNDLDSIIEQKIREREDQKEFTNKLQEIVSSNELNKEEQAQLAEEYKELVKHGMSKSKAIDKAARICGYGVKSQIEQARKDGVRIGKMALPQQGKQAQPQGSSDFFEMTDEEIINATLGRNVYKS